MRETIVVSDRSVAEPRRIRRPLRPGAYALWLAMAALATGSALARAWTLRG